MTPQEEKESLAALAGLGALDGADAEAWQRLCAQDPETARLGERMEQTVALLGLLTPAVAPPAELRDRIMASISVVPAPDFSSASATPQASGGWSWAAAASIALLAAWAGVAGWNQKETVLVQDARPDAGTPFVLLSGSSPASATVLWDSGQRGWYLQAANLPAPPAGAHYEVWVVGDPAAPAQACGPLPLNHQGHGRTFLRPPSSVDQMTGFIVTLETGDGSPQQPSREIVLRSRA